MDAKQLEETLRSSNLLYKRAYDNGYETGKREAYAHFKMLLEQAEKMALLKKQAE